MGDSTPGEYFPTPALTIARSLIILGGLVGDNLRTNEPSGVVPTIDARTGALVWARDIVMAFALPKK
ncbi:glucose dehydrogenase [Rhodanobacter sp. A1T4]|nr:glucose dehydrogenase [Rhodanobacter sp. MP1X3]MBB6246242.1 glucose dehydrogenase [Rhodanobacter sp. A1T4]